MPMSGRHVNTQWYADHAPGYWWCPPKLACCYDLRGSGLTHENNKHIDMNSAILGPKGVDVANSLERFMPPTKHLEGKLGTPLMGVNGLWVAIVQDVDGLQPAIQDLIARMRKDRVSSGVLVLSQPLAATVRGPVPQQLLEAGVTWHRSRYANVSKGAYALLEEYLVSLESMERSFADLDALVQAEQEQQHAH